MSDTSSLRDEELVQRFVAGDAKAFDEIVRRHRDRVYNTVGPMLRNPQDAEEITQDTFIRAHAGLSRFRGDSSLVTWLYRVAVNLARNRWWYHVRRKKHLTDSLDYPLNEDGDMTVGDITPSGDPLPTSQIEHDETASLAARMMEQLTPMRREILILRNEQHKEYEEIARILGVDVGTVKSRIARAREELWARMARECPALLGIRDRKPVAVPKKRYRRRNNPRPEIIKDEITS